MLQMKLGCERGMGGSACFISSDVLDDRFVGELIIGWSLALWLKLLVQWQLVNGGWGVWGGCCLSILSLNFSVSSSMSFCTLVLQWCDF